MSDTQPKALRLVHSLSGGKLIDDSTEWADTLHAAATELLRQHARIAELEASESRTITQRDHCEEVIDRMADAVLGKDRHEWTSNYDYMNAAQEVEDRIAELEKDAARLLYATKDYDGFVHVKRDKYEFTLECMEEAGRSEPTIEDELNGVRRLIDAAIAAQTKKGKQQ